MLQVYTGDGKGKTTAALGLALRALGAGKRVYIMQFMKSRAYSEHNILPRFSPQLVAETTGKPFFIAEEGSLTADMKKALGDVVVFKKGKPPEDYAKLTAAGLTKAVAAGKDFDVVILDEINVALYFGLLKDDFAAKQISALQSAAPATEIICTGRNAPPWLVNAADLVTDMREVKHYYTKGIAARLGIEN